MFAIESATDNEQNRDTELAIALPCFRVGTVRGVQNRVENDGVKSVVKPDLVVKFSQFSFCRIQ